ncbi:hypothetical protein HZC35_03260 [Candidatus Saganbacteria bacterium]|nr:hypothetical protein [Candidatus Saganbacteria bacterium]
MKKAIILLAFLLIGQASMAYHVAFLGGVREGFAVGTCLENPLPVEWAEFRYGLEGSTGPDLSLLGDNPLVLFGGFELPIMRTATGSPLYLNLGAVAYSGTNPLFGPAASLRLEGILNRKDLFLEAGMDFMPDFTRVQVQLGYKMLGNIPEVLLE